LSLNCLLKIFFLALFLLPKFPSGTGSWVLFVCWFIFCFVLFCFFPNCQLFSLFLIFCVFFSFVLNFSL
jgi:hypothetical protein